MLSSLASGGVEALKELLDPQPQDAEVVAQVVKIMSYRIATRSESAPRLLSWLGFNDAREVRCCIRSSTRTGNRAEGYHHWRCH